MNDFSSIEWSKDIYFLKVEIDLSNSTGLIFLGTSQLLSVPYDLDSLNIDNLILTATNGKRFKIQIDTNGTIYSALIPNITCPGLASFVYGGQTYNTVQIGTQCWMKENLNIGSMIIGSVEQTNNSIIEKYCYNDDPYNCGIYGGIYQWNEMMQYITTEKAQGICPQGWHIPSDAGWTTLTDFLGGENIAGGKMKTTGTIETITGLWANPNSSATDESGLSVLPLGYRSSNGLFYYKDFSAYL